MLALPDWSVPWLAPYRTGGDRALCAAEAAQSVCAGLNLAATVSGAENESVSEKLRQTVTFVSQSSLAPGVPYEQFIFDTRTVPTRDNLHDFFNGLVWLHFPHTKQRLNQLQARAIAAHGVQAHRGPLRDALTVFDENGAVLCAPPALWAALRARDWMALFVGLRPRWSQARLVLVGHALLEKLVSPRKPMVAHVYQGPEAIDSIAILDAWLAGDICPQRWSDKPFVPLPVLGVPGWCAANEDAGFYADREVFRTARTHPGRPG